MRVNDLTAVALALGCPLNMIDTVCLNAVSTLYAGAMPSTVVERVGQVMLNLGLSPTR